MSPLSYLPVLLALSSQAQALIAKPDFAGAVRLTEPEADASTIGARDAVPDGYVAAP